MNKQIPQSARALLLALALLTTGSLMAASLSVTVLDKDGQPVQDAVVVVVPVAKGQPREPLPRLASVVQERMRFMPAVSVVSVGARVTFVNNDSWDHHVRGSAPGLAQFSSDDRSGFELRLAGKEPNKPARTLEVALDKPGAVLLGCHLHASMRGHVYVSDSPWALSTSAQGQARFDDLPDGPAQVRVWQAEQLIELAPQTVTLKTTPTQLNVQLQVVARRKRL